MIKGMGTKYTTELLDLLNLNVIESIESIYEKLNRFVSGKKRVELPSFGQFSLLMQKAEDILKKQEEQGVFAFNYYSNNYPEKFRRIPSPPVILFAKGNLSLLHGYKHIALVGSRNATAHGLKVAHRLGELLAKDNIVVSGLAMGCDAQAHVGCLDVGGKTIAILPSPVTSPEPKENRELADRIIESGGLLLSEYYDGQSVNKGSFIARDRLQSALSDSVVVVETRKNGGTMHAVQCCKEYKKLLACYKHPYKYENLSTLDGNRFLLQTGALPLGSREDIENYYKHLEEKRKELKESEKIVEQLRIELA